MLKSPKRTKLEYMATSISSSALHSELKKEVGEEGGLYKSVKQCLLVKCLDEIEIDINSRSDGPVHSNS